MRKFLSLLPLALGVALFLFWKGEELPSDWMDRAIARDFKRFEKGITKEALEETWACSKRHKEMHRYQVIDSKVYGPPSRIKLLLEELVNRFPVPNVDFIYYYEDRLKPSFFQRRPESAPIFVSAKNQKIDRAILFADWNYHVQDENSGWNLLIKKINASQVEWNEKKETIFWRGMPWDGKHFGMYDFENWTTLPRGKIVSESRKDPDLIDAAFSEYPAKCVKENLDRCVREMGAITFVAWEEMTKFKYHMILDGVTCSFPATQWKLLSGSLSFKQDSADIQYYYGELAPWVHYIPVKNDLSDLREKLHWAKLHDKEAKQIAQNAREFALSHLMPDHILTYCYKVLCKYASLQRFDPALEKDQAQDR